jgi:twitching motility two-component system response regulator PilH
MPIKKVLIVDDSPTERFFLNELLTKQGFAVSMAENAEEAMMKVKAVMPDLILMDVVMPGLNGFQATRQLTRDPDTAAIPIVIVTTKNQETDRVWGVRQGARAYLTKPIDERKLLDTIKQILAG